MRLQAYIAANAPRLTLDEVINRIDDVSTLPHIIPKTMEVANNPDSSARDLKEVIETDAALSARVLRCVNSSAYALRLSITNLQQAISYLGMQEIRRLALTASVAEMFARDEVIGTYQRRALWRHLVAVGLCARLIAMRQKVTEFEDVFIAGLLHDIGIVLEDQYLHDRFCAAMQSLDGKATLSEMERKQMDFDHAMLGARLAENWHFPEAVKAAIAYHHMSVNYSGASVLVVRCVEVANMICTIKGYSSVGQKLVRASQPALAALALSRDHLAVLAQDVDDELARNSALLTM